MKPIAKSIATVTSIALCVLLSACQTAVKDGGTDDIQAYLHLFKKNSIAGKVLDVTYSMTGEGYEDGNVYTGTPQRVHLVFDTQTGKHREETTRERESSDDEDYFRPGTTIFDSHVEINIWDGKEFVRWYPGRHILDKQGRCEYVSGYARITDWCESHLMFLRLFGYNSRKNNRLSFHPFEEWITECDPKIERPDRDTITIDTELYKFEFSKKSGILKRFTFFQPVWDEENNKEKEGERYVDEIYDFSNHVERSGIWLPLTVTISEPVRKTKLGLPSGEVIDTSMGGTVTYSVDPDTLRLLDQAEDPSVFTANLPVECSVEDKIRKDKYTIKKAGETTLGTPKVETMTEGAEPGLWTMDLDAAKKAAAEKNLPILLSFAGSDWNDVSCSMERNVFWGREWKAFAKGRLMLILIDFPQDESLVPEKYVERNLQLGIKHGVTPVRLPTFIILAPDGEKVLGTLTPDRDATSTEKFIQQVQALLGN